MMDGSSQPDWRRIVRDRLATLELDPAFKHDVVEELSQHLEQRYVELRSRGASAEVARVGVLRELDAEGFVEALRVARRATEPPLLGSQAGRADALVTGAPTACDIRTASST